MSTHTVYKAIAIGHWGHIFVLCGTKEKACQLLIKKLSFSYLWYDKDTPDEAYFLDLVELERYREAFEFFQDKADPKKVEMEFDELSVEETQVEY